MFPKGNDEQEAAADYNSDTHTKSSLAAQQCSAVMQSRVSTTQDTAQDSIAHHGTAWHNRA